MKNFMNIFCLGFVVLSTNFATSFAESEEASKSALTIIDPVKCMASVQVFGQAQGDTRELESEITVSQEDERIKFNDQTDVVDQDDNYIYISKNFEITIESIRYSISVLKALDLNSQTEQNIPTYFSAGVISSQKGYASKYIGLSENSKMITSRVKNKIVRYLSLNESVSVGDKVHRINVYCNDKLQDNTWKGMFNNKLDSILEEIPFFNISS